MWIPSYYLQNEKEILEKVDTYLESCTDTYEEVLATTTTNEREIAWQTMTETKKTVNNKLKAKIPTIEGLAIYLWKNRDTMYERSKSHTDFADKVKQLRTLQADRMINWCIDWTYNYMIWKMLLSTNGYAERIENINKNETVTSDEEDKINNALWTNIT